MKAKIPAAKLSCQTAKAQAPIKHIVVPTLASGVILAPHVSGDNVVGSANGIGVGEGEKGRTACFLDKLVLEGPGDFFQKGIGGDKEVTCHL
jgi:hypothetical protein